jgi:hypothetical protein
VLARILVSASSLIMLLLGSIHLLYTFSGNKLVPRDPAVQQAMSATPMVLTSETTVWRAWVGFNASHSMCALFFGLVFGFLAVAHPELLFRSVYLQLFGVAVLVGFVVLAKLYWFTIPLVGVSIALACFLAGLLASSIHSQS